MPESPSAPVYPEARVPAGAFVGVAVGGAFVGVAFFEMENATSPSIRPTRNVG